MTYEVLCVGAVNVDTIALVDRLPAVDERLVAEELASGQGGPAATAAVTLARLGRTVALCATVGRDPEGDATIAGLEDEGVDVRWISRDPDRPTARSVVLVDRATRSRAIVTSAYASRPAYPPLHLADVVHVDQAGYGPVMAALGADQRRVRVSIDAGNPIPALDLAGTWLYAPTVTSLVERYGGGIAEAMSAAHDEGAELVVATDGSRGSYGSGRGDAEPLRAGAFDVEVASSLGAGDVFHGALLASLVEERPLQEALTRASASAALSCRALDGRSAIPGADELDRFLSETKPAETR